MLSSRTKIIILIIGAVIIFGLIVATIFNLWPGKEAPLPGKEKTGLENVDLSFLEQPTTAQGQEFDSSSRGAFEQAFGSPASATISPLEQEARSLAAFFIERLGTYSSDADFANIDDLRSFMTPAMRSWAERFRQSQPQSNGYAALETEVASLTTNSFVPAPQNAGRAVFDIIANRTESKGSDSESYQQKATIELAQESSGSWLVSSLYWGERL